MFSVSERMVDLIPPRRSHQDQTDGVAELFGHAGLPSG
jgi:hypothetical protein